MHFQENLIEMKLTWCRHKTPKCHRTETPQIRPDTKHNKSMPVDCDSFLPSNLSPQNTFSVSRRTSFVREIPARHCTCKRWLIFLDTSDFGSRSGRIRTNHQVKEHIRHKKGPQKGLVCLRHEAVNPHARSFNVFAITSSVREGQVPS